MKQPVGEKLKNLGLDIEFLAWLEGDDDRLPFLGQIHKVRDRDFAGAIRAAAWLEEHSSDPRLISPNTPETWEDRYEVLLRFLCTAVKFSWGRGPLGLPDDLVALETVLRALLPQPCGKIYSKDIQLLRKRGQPPDLSDVAKLPAKASGGSPPSEETDRMRAAIHYISGRSRTPYVDLADFWNERYTTDKYDPQKIKDRLRSGSGLSRTPGSSQRLLELWKSVYYEREFRWSFPGPFPLSPKLAELFKDRESDGSSS